jgi:hypothetical protein
VYNLIFGAGWAGYSNGSFCATLRDQENMAISRKIFSDMANKLDPIQRQVYFAAMQLDLFPNKETFIFD